MRIWVANTIAIGAIIGGTLATAGCDEDSVVVSGHHVDCARGGMASTVSADVLPSGFPIPPDVKVEHESKDGGTTEVVLCPAEDATDAIAFYRDHLTGTQFKAGSVEGVKWAGLQAQELTVTGADGAELGSVIATGVSAARFIVITMQS